MKRALRKTVQELYYWKNNKKILGAHSKITGNISGLIGNISGLRGIVTNIAGNIDLCNITNSEREKSVNIQDLVMQ